MSLLQKMILQLNKEDIRSYKLLAKRTNVNEDRKDLFLFDKIKNSKQKSDEQKTINSLYGGNKNAYFRLKNRLLKDIEKSQILQHGFKNDSVYNYLQLSLAKVLKEKLAFNLALTYLKRTEKKATQANDYSLLELIYKELLDLSQEDSSINVIELIEKKKINRKNLQNIQEFDEIIAAARYKINTTQSFSKKNESIISLLEQTVKLYSKNIKTLKNPKLQLQMYQAVSRVLLQQANYKALEEYLIHTHKKFNRIKMFNKHNHDLKLEMIVFIINSLFKNEKYKASLKYTEILKTEMKQFTGSYYDKYLFYYYNSLVINYSKSDFGKAIDILLEAKKESAIQKHPSQLLFIEINLMQLYFDSSQYKSAVKIASRLSINDEFLNLNKAYQLRLMISELIVRFEIGDFDLLEYRLNQIQKDYKKLLRQADFKRELIFIQLLADLTITQRVRASKTILAKINAFLALITDEQADDQDVLNINAWLKRKIE